jgi:hypothetical protein
MRPYSDYSIYVVARPEPEPWSCIALDRHRQKRLLGKRSASGRRRYSGSSGQTTNRGKKAYSVCAKAWALSPVAELAVHACFSRTDEVLGGIGSQAAGIHGRCGILQDTLRAVESPEQSSSMPRDLATGSFQPITTVPTELGSRYQARQLTVHSFIDTSEAPPQSAQAGGPEIDSGRRMTGLRAGRVGPPQRLCWLSLKDKVGAGPSNAALVMSARWPVLVYDSEQTGKRLVDKLARFDAGDQDARVPCG